MPSTAKVDYGPPERLTGVPTTVLDQLVKGVVDAEDEGELEELLPLPAQATSVIGRANMINFFKTAPLNRLLLIIAIHLHQKSLLKANYLATSEF